MRNLLVILALVGITVAVFGQVWHHDFVVMDDHLYVSGNPHVRTGLSADNVVWAFTRVHDANWIPLTWISLMVDAEFFGDDAGGYHLVSLVYHIGATLLLFAFLMRATGEIWPSALVAALFAIHPLHVESVAWLPERKDVLSTLFGMAALWAYVEYSRRGSRTLYAAALFAFGCSLLAKQMLVTLPFLLLLLDWWPLGRWATRPPGEEPVEEAPPAAEAVESERVVEPQFQRRRPAALIAEKLPFFLMSLVFCGIVFFAQSRGGAVRSLEHFPLGVRIANAVDVTVIYLAKTFWPLGLAAYYPHPEAGISYASVTAATVVLAGITLAVLVARRRRFLAVGWFWYLGTLVPVVGLVQIGTQRMADRYTYVPLVGVFIAVAWLVPSLLPAGRVRRIVAPAAATVVVGALAFVAWRQTAVWKDSVALFEHTLAVTGDNAVARINLGKALMDRGAMEAALGQFEKAVALAPESATAHLNLGTMLHTLDRRSEAARHLAEAVRLAPNLSTARVNLANLYRDERRRDDAIRLYREALKINPEDFAASINLGIVLIDAGRPDEAADVLKSMLRVDPGNVRALTILGISAARQGNPDEAIRILRRAVHLERANFTAQFNLGAALFAARQYDEAEHHFETAVRLDPNHREARLALASIHLNRGTQAAQNGNLSTAITAFAEAHEVAPDDWRTAYNLGSALQLAGQTPRAIELLAEAVTTNPKSAEARHRLGRLLLDTGRKKEAAEHLREAVRLRPGFPEAKQDLKRATE